MRILKLHRKNALWRLGIYSNGSEGQYDARITAQWRDAFQAGRSIRDFAEFTRRQLSFTKSARRDWADGICRIQTDNAAKKLSKFHLTTSGYGSFANADYVIAQCST